LLFSKAVLSDIPDHSILSAYRIGIFKARYIFRWNFSLSAEHIALSLEG
jgi:hypothetical protein